MQLNDDASSIRDEKQGRYFIEAKVLGEELEDKSGLLPTPSKRCE